jgi:SAM-dependent methyltransferase
VALASPIRRALGVARIYDLFQTAVGAPASKRHFVHGYVKAKPDNRVLDLGCGTGAMLELLPPGISYVGVEINDGYVRHARELLGQAGTFVCADLTTFEPTSKFDIVVAHGVMHHLDDSGVLAACSVAHRALEEGGRVVFAEPCRIPTQSHLETAIMDRDRGGHIRTPEHYRDLMSHYFEPVSMNFMHGSYRIPYTMLILEAQR